MSETTTTTPARPLVGTIVWGVILLVVAGVAFAASFIDIREISPVTALWAIVGTGVLLVLAAVVGVIARLVRPGSPSPASTTEAGEAGDAGDAGHQPIG